MAGYRYLPDIVSYRLKKINIINYIYISAGLTLNPTLSIPAIVLFHATCTINGDKIIAMVTLVVIKSYD